MPAPGYPCPCGENFASVARLRAHEEYVRTLPTKTAKEAHGRWVSA